MKKRSELGKVSFTFLAVGFLTVLGVLFIKATEGFSLQVDTVAVKNPSGPCTPGQPCAATITPLVVTSAGGGIAPAPNGTPAPVSLTNGVTINQFLGSTNSVQLQTGGLVVSGTNPLPVIIQTAVPTAQVQIYQAGPITVQYTVTPQIQAYVQTWPTPGGVCSQGTPGPNSAAWPVLPVEPHGTPYPVRPGDAIIAGVPMMATNTSGNGGANEQTLNSWVPNSATNIASGSSYALIMTGENYLKGATNTWDSWFEPTTRINSTDGIGVGLVAMQWATQGPVTTHATGALATFAPQISYRDITVQLNGIGGSGAVTAAITSSLDGTNWVSIGVLTGAGNSNAQATITEHYSPDWAVSILGIGASTTISSWIYAGE